MFSANGVNNSKDNVFLKTLCKNVYDTNGIDLEGLIQVMFSEIEKREIKRCYFELTDFDLTGNYTTYDILNQMEDNTISILAIENDSHLVSEIGSRLGGVLVLIKKTSVYFSAGLFFTYRYGELFVGASGLGGNSFEWHKGTTATIHSYHDGTTRTLTKVNEYEILSNWGGQSVNPRLTQVDGVITIPSGVNYIMISAYVVLESVEAGTKFLQLFKNGAESKIMIKSTVNGDVTLSLTPMIIDVQEGDTIDLRINSNSLDRIRSKHFTIEII